MQLNSLHSLSEQKTAVVIQCRLSSTRLPGKALLDLGGKPVLEWTLNALKKVPANRYFLAVDTESYQALEPVAKKCGYECYAGSQQDVLKRFCDVINFSGVDVVLRGTADNPFLFYEAAISLLEEYFKRNESSKVDYITYSKLPHGSGIEIFNAHSLLEAATGTQDPYDHEHVGPALYHHQGIYKCEFIEAPKRFNYPSLRTTIDLPSDYRRALRIVDFISGDSEPKEPYTTEQIVEALSVDHIKNPSVLIPSLQPGNGTGHLRRCLDIAAETKCDIFIPKSEDEDSEKTTSSDFSKIVEQLVEQAKEKGLKDWQIVTSLQNPEQYNLAITDSFVSNSDFLKNLSLKCPTACIDEGNRDTEYVDFLLDVIPGLSEKTEPNLECPALMPLPKNRKENPLSRTEDIKKILVVFGGEDPFSLTDPCVEALCEGDYEITAIRNADAEGTEKINKNSNVKYCSTIPNLKEQLYLYDLVVTHYGFTAYEAKAAGCGVLLVAPTVLHSKLGKKWGFAQLEKNSISFNSFMNVLESKTKEVFQPLDSLNSFKVQESPEQKNEKAEISAVSRFVKNLSQGHRLNCPVCGKSDVTKDPLAGRTPQRTFRRCSSCGMLYMSWTMQSKQTEYNHEYFFDDYEKQYGKTYLEDFEGIKNQCRRRVGIINKVCKKYGEANKNSILDIGCAMGPFLDAAAEKGWQVYGTDICSEAVEYVKNTLHYPAVCSSFPNFNAPEELGVENFDAVTMWYVIEHFQDLDAVLKTVSSLVKKGGVFAFSTPSGSGISGKYNTQSFFAQSPQDHYTIWEPSTAASILRRYGFKVEKMVSTGIHPERLPKAVKEQWKKDSFKFRAVQAAGKILMLGDTFEVYCKKIF